MLIINGISTYLTLQNAFEVKDVFDCLSDLDADYKYAPTVEQWEVGKKYVHV